MATTTIKAIELPNGDIANITDKTSGYVATDATTSAHGLMSASDKTKLNGIASGAEVNQNAFSNVAIGASTISADSKTDTLTLVGGANITLTPDATNDKITILLDDTVDTGEVIATDIQAGNLIVNGTSRFLNTINGTASNSEKLNGQSLTSTYSSTGTAPITGAAVASAIGTLDGTVSGSPSASKTLTAFSQTDGKVSATFGNISITKSQVSDFPTLGTAAAKNYTTSVSSGSADLVTSGAVWTAIDNLPEPMVFKGSLGTGGTITALPVDGTAKVGDTYKVITAGTYASKAAKVGDTFICLTKTSSANTWELIPSGDEPSGTVTSVGISNGGGLSVSGSPITSSGTITISHSDTSSQASVSNSGRTYIQSITLDTYGHVTKLTSATETVTNTDRYVNSAAFAHDSTNDNVEMTLTRAGSDTATVTANIPKVSSSSSGVVPKGTTVSSQSQTTKFLREDGTWAAPSYTTNTNTTYTIGTSGNNVTLTPSSGSVQSITVPYATTAGALLTGSASGDTHAAAIKAYFDANKSTVPRNKAVSLYSSAYSNGSQYIGYYLSSYDSTPYGGFFVAHYNKPFYVGIQSGTYTEYKLARIFSTPTNNQVVIADGTEGILKTSGYTIGKSVPSDAVFTDHYAWTDITGKPNRAGSDSDGGAANTLKNFQVSLTGSLGLDISTNSVGYVGGLTRADWNYQMADGAIYGQTYSAAWKHEIFGDYRTGHMSVRGKNNGTWQPWNLVLDSGNVGYVYSSTITYNPHERKFITSKSTSAWDAQVYSKQGYIDNVYVSFRPTQANMAMMIGLDSNPSESTGYDKIDYCWYTQNSGGLSIYENNTSIASITGHTTYAAGDELRVEYSGGYVRYYHNGVLCRSVARAIGEKLYMDSSLHGASSTFYDVYFGNSITKASAAATADTATTASKLGSSNVGSATNPIYLASGTATACTYSLNKTVPSDAVFTDQYVSQSATTTSDYRKIVLSYQNGAAGAAVVANTNVVYVTANAEVQPSTGNIRSGGTVSAANLSASGNVSGTTLGVISSSGTGGGISLYNGTGNVTTYGIAMRKTTDSGKHGYVQGDWGIYNYMSGGTTRGWVWRYGNTTNVASISSEGHAAFTGSVTIGANATNTSGVRQVYNETTKSLDFVFVA